MAFSGGSSAGRRTNRVVAIWLAVLSVVLLGYLLTQDWVYDQQRDGFRLGFFSVVGAIAMLLCAVAMMFDRQRDETTPEMATITLRQTGKSLVALVLMGIFFILAWDDHFAQEWLRGILDVIPLTGEFVVWASLFLAFGMYALGLRPALSALISGVIVSLVIFGLFRLIGITLPTSLLQS